MNIVCFSKKLILMKFANINKSTCKKETDIFGIPPKLVTMAANTLKNQIPILFNLSITQEICPDKLKTGQINQVHKFESKMLYSNYRPISILPLFSKVFERLMFNRIYNFVIKHEIIYKNQFGFQKENLLNMQF